MKPFTVYMPRVEQRREWHRIAKAGGRQRQNLGPPLAFCSSCSVGIGQLYFQRELYLLPSVRLRKRRAPELRWSLLCGLCALEDYHLSFGYCLVAEQDWEQHPVFELSVVESAKQQQLNTFLLSAWPESLEGISDVIQRLSPPVATVSDLDGIEMVA